MFVWKEEYGCGIIEIDTQHKRLFELVSELHGIASIKDGYDHYDDIMRVFQELSDYTVYHFSYEEQLMEQNGYDPAQLRAHKWEHVSFISKMKQLQDADLDSNQRKVLMDAIMFAVDWIEKHILTTDRQYATFFKAAGLV